MITEFRKKLADGHCVLGPFMKTSDPAFIEAAGHAGFDFVILDLEHGPNDVAILQNLVRGAQCAGVLPVVRVPDSGEVIISKCLDVGAMGIQAPQVNSAQQAEKIIRAMRFAPKGERGVCRFVRAANYSSLDRYEYFRDADLTLAILQLEGLEAVRNIDEILKVDGIDILFIGPYDLSQSLGIPGQTQHPSVIDKMLQIVKKAKAAGMCIGTFVDTPDNAKFWKSKGVQYLSYSVDVGIFLESCKNIINETGGSDVL